MADKEPVRIVLTPDQREIVKRVSGQHVDMIELAPDDNDDGSGPLRFVWRISAASGIPRQKWTSEDETTT